jgi:hypothetical protein
LLPGAQLLGWSHAADENPQASRQIQVDGQAFGGVAYELDGTDNQDPILGIIVVNPSLDSVTEAKITTQNFDAELGKAVSAVMTVQTKSGSNSYHGSAYDFRTGNANLARDPFSQCSGNFSLSNTCAIPPGVKNKFGGSSAARSSGTSCLPSERMRDSGRRSEVLQLHPALATGHRNLPR